MELILDKYEYKKKSVQSLAIPSGSSVKLACFSHLKDSSNITMSFQLQQDNITHSAACPVEVGSASDCLHVQEWNWRVCRNKTEPHNCILVLHGFGESDCGNYTCSTTIGGREIQSNVLKLEAPNSPHKHNSSNIVITLSIVITTLIIMVPVLVLLGVFVFKIVKKLRGKI